MGIIKNHVMKTSNFKKILVPVSFERGGAIALKQALYFRRKHRSEITLLHVIPGRVTSVLQPNLNKRLKARALVRLIRFAKVHFRSKIPDNVKLRVELGNYVTVIKDIARAERFNLIVLHRNNRLEGLIDKLRKNKVEHIVEQSTCPVLSVNERYTTKGVRKILIPVDVGKKSGDLVKWSVFLGNMMNADITLLAVLNVNIELERSLAYKKTQIMRSLIEQEGITCRVRVVKRKCSNRLKALVEEAKWNRADLVMLQGQQDLMFSNTEGERILSEFLLNSPQPLLCLGVKEEGFIVDLLASSKSKKPNLTECLSPKAIPV